MEDIKQEGLTLREAMKYLYLGDRIWNTWTGERHSVICHYWEFGMEKYREIDIDEDPTPLWFWSIIPYPGFGKPKWWERIFMRKRFETYVPEKLTWGEITSPVWCSETTSESV